MSDRLSFEELLGRYQRADSEAFDQFFKRSHRLLFQFLLRRLGNRSDAEEALQETYLKIHKAILNYDVARSALAWVFTIARHVAIDRLRRRREIALGTDIEQFMPQAVHAAGAASVIDELLAPLSLSDQDLVRRRFLAEESYDDIAAARGLTAVNVRQRISRLLRRMRKTKTSPW